MENRNYKQHRKFKNQVNHMQGFIGMPMWNYRNPSLSEIREYDRRVLELQAQQSHSKSRSTGKWFYGLLHNSFKQLGKVYKQLRKTSTKKETVKISPEYCS
jgi:hypothetical protein